MSQTSSQPEERPIEATSYTPAVGDVVEMRKAACSMDPFKALLFKEFGEGKLQYVAESGTWGKFDGEARLIKKLGFSSFKVGEYADACKALKAYFDGKQAEPDGSNELEYKVGDLVEVVGVSHGVGGDYIGEVGEVEQFDSDGEPYLNFKNRTTEILKLTDIRPLSGTYVERQAKWVEFYGLKVGDKVKVVRKFENWEAWSNHGSHDIGREVRVKNLGTTYICSTSGTFYPYFALEPVTPVK